MKVKTNSFLNHTFITNLINNKSVMLDLGANNGEFSKFIKRLYGGKIYAIEAIPDLYENTKEMLDVKSFNYCVSDSNKLCKIKVPENGCASNKVNKINGEEIEVPGITLDKFLLDQQINRVDLLKMDIEGAEIEVFESISKKTLEKINQITVEFHDFLWPELKPKVKEIKKKIKLNGFYCIPFSLTNNGDVLFIRKNSISFFNYLYLKYLIRYLLGIKRKF
ncbi:MAG: FkbM family methyltransferase [Parcubacteria group bacterium CG10_big_fil_rev_8_21_14_0_10_36_14]|nr:MAG: FkbM family methyltransferase [Parcubacteria group bacterium CG10_big_fil_rev_8_21_14_0_10_36_14]